eukprot:26067-Ditylum_brightwellii.AAC.1
MEKNGQGESQSFHAEIAFECSRKVEKIPISRASYCLYYPSNNHQANPYHRAKLHLFAMSINEPKIEPKIKPKIELTETNKPKIDPKIEPINKPEK